jgi:hypothetical protein
VGFDEPRVERRRCGGRIEQGGRAVAIRRAKQLPEELFGALRRVQVQRHADAGAFEAPPQFVALHRDAAPVDLNDETPRCIGRIELGLERRIDGPEKPVDLTAPMGWRSVTLATPACASIRAIPAVALSSEDFGNRDRCSSNAR